MWPLLVRPPKQSHVCCPQYYKTTPAQSLLKSLIILLHAVGIVWGMFLAWANRWTFGQFSQSSTLMQSEFTWVYIICPLPNIVVFTKLVFWPIIIWWNALLSHAKVFLQRCHCLWHNFMSHWIWRCRGYRGVWLSYRHPIPCLHNCNHPISLLSTHKSCTLRGWSWRGKALCRVYLSTLGLVCDLQGHWIILLSWPARDQWVVVDADGNPRGNVL